jgi:hypothetical protein
MKKLLIPLIFLLALIFAVCSKDDNGTITEPPPPIITRVVVDTLAVAPLLTSVDEATWSNVDSTLVRIGYDQNNYGRDAMLGEQEITVKAIKKSDTLYIWVRWHDYSAHVWGNYIKKRDDTVTLWERVATEGDDVFDIFLYAPDSSSDSGSYDIWEWMATATAPGRMAEDRWKTPLDSITDLTINYYVYRTNPMAGSVPVVMHDDTTDFTGPYLFITDTAEFYPAGPIIDWPIGYRMPGYFIDSSIFHLPTRDQYSRWDVKAISHFDSTQASLSDYTWTVVFARALNTQHNEDVNLSGLDSVKVAFRADNRFATSDLVTLDYSGSAPFWIILKP